MHCTFCSQLVLESDYSLWCIFKGAGLRKRNEEIHRENARVNEPLILNRIKMVDYGLKNKQKCKESTHRNIIYIECSWELVQNWLLKHWCYNQVQNWCSMGIYFLFP